MKPTHNLVVGESYEKDGEQKTRWTNIGVLMTGERDGKRRTVIKLNVVPVGDWDGFINVFPIEKSRVTLLSMKQKRLGAYQGTTLLTSLLI